MDAAVLAESILTRCSHGGAIKWIAADKQVQDPNEVLPSTHMPFFPVKTEGNRGGVYCSPTDATTPVRSTRRVTCVCCYDVEPALMNEAFGAAMLLWLRTLLGFLNFELLCEFETQ